MNKTPYMISSILFVIIICLAIYLFLSNNRIDDLQLEEDLKTRHIESEAWLSDPRRDPFESEPAQIIDISESPLGDDFTKKVATLIERNISDIIKEKPMKGGQWVVTTIRFIDSSTVLVDYEDGHDSFDSQIRITKNVESFSFEIVK